MMSRRAVRPVLAGLLLMGLASLGFARESPGGTDGALPSPREFFGFKMGEDRKLAGWDKLLDYYQLLARSSNRLRLQEVGKSTEGRPFIILFISSPENLAKLDHYRELNARLADPRGLSEAQGRKLISESKPVIIQSFGQHSDEVASAQTAAEFVYDSITRADEGATRIRDAVISIVMPSLNPDGTQMIADWYMKYVNTEHEAAEVPWLYQLYAGHDNNRDGFALNLLESRHFAQIVYRDWLPQAYVDHHQMDIGGARMVIAPYADPIRPNADPLVWREMAWYGANMGERLEAAGKQGVINSAIFYGWMHTGFHAITAFHNIAGMMTESAGLKLATPVYLHVDQLRGGAPGMPTYDAQMGMPNPWPGGWWHVRDVVEQQKIAAWATVDLAARNSETVLWNMYLKGTRQTARGADGPVKSYVIEVAQHDALTTKKLINLFLANGVEVQQADEEFVADDKLYSAGSFVITMAQPKQGLVRWMLGRTFYPDNAFTHDAKANPIRPYDVATDTMGEFMGVRSDPVGAPITAKLTRLAAPVPLMGSVAARTSDGYVLSTKLNDSFRAVFLLLEQGVTVRRARGGEGFTPGDFIVTHAAPAVLADVAHRTGVDFAALDGRKPRDAYDIRKPRVGLFKRYKGGNMDEGWTRLMFTQFDVPYTSLMDARIKKGNLNASYDVIVLPDDALKMMTMTGEPSKEEAHMAQPSDNTPPEFRSGFGEEGIKALQAFVQNGGILVTFGEAGDLPMQRFGLSLRNVVAELPPKDFWSPGSTLRTRFDIENPIAYGMPPEGLVLFYAGSTRQFGAGQVYELTSFEKSQDVSVIGNYAEREILQSGWLVGERVIAKKAAAVSVRYGSGKVVMIGFRPQHRAQTHGTFKIVFNALLNGPPAGR